MSDTTADAVTITRDFTVEATDVTNNPEAWTTEKIAQVERESIEFWSKIADDDKRALAVISRDCLIRLMENPLEWLPTSLKPEGGARMAMFIYISVDEVEKQVLVMREQAERELVEQMNDLLEINDELREDSFDE